jgi:hypothetical protein
MGDLIAKYKNLIILGGVVIVGGVVFVTMSGGNAALTGAPPQDSESAQIEQELINELLQLQAIELNNAIFNNALFLSLTDFSKPLEEERVGRNNPFAPVGAAAAATTTATP